MLIEIMYRDLRWRLTLYFHIGYTLIHMMKHDFFILIYWYANVHHFIKMEWDLCVSGSLPSGYESIK